MAQSNNATLLTTLNNRFARHVDAQEADEKQPMPAPEPRAMLDRVIDAIPESAAAWAIQTRYPSPGFKDRIAKARETLVLLRNLLVDGE